MQQRPAIRHARHRRTVARFGEEVAAWFLRRRGARILARNVRVGRDEIDLLVEFAGERVAVEVKARGPGGGEPLDGFDTAKALKVRRAASGVDPPVHRVDLIAVTAARDGVRVRWVPRAG